MAFKLPEQDNAAKFSNVIQLICFAGLFLLIYLPLRQIVHMLFLRILILIGDYIVVSLLVFTVIRPLMQKLENKIRNKRK